MLSERHFVLRDPAATKALGRVLGRHLRAGDLLALHGELGAGKTCLVRGLAEGLGVLDPEAVSSPTYLLVVEHPGPIPLIHMDAYLPAKLAGFLADGGLDYVTGQPAVVAVEWAERVPGLVGPMALRVELRAASAGREVTLRGDAVRFPWLAGLDESALMPEPSDPDAR